MAGEWRVESFPDVIDFQEGPGILAKDFREEGIPLVRLSGLDRGGSVLAGCNYLDPETVAKRWSHFALAEGDILLSTSASLGRIAVVGGDGVGAIPYTGIIRMRPLDARLIAPFIRYLLEGPDFQRQAEMVGAGSVIRHFGPMHLRQMSVRLPPPEEQRAIAHILGTLDDKIELNRRMSETLEAMARALFKAWFVDFEPVRAKHARSKVEGMEGRWQRGSPLHSPLPAGEGSGVRAALTDRAAVTVSLPADLRDFARELRRRTTDAEALLWRLLRNRHMAGAKFRRQHPLSPYVLDFYCHDAGLAVELDGGQHNEATGRRHDARRDAFLAQKGIRVLRFWNHEVLNQTEAVLEAIYAAVGQASSRVEPSPPAPLPAGEGSFHLPAHLYDLFPDRLVDSELGEIPEGWEVRSLDQIARFLNGLALQKFPPNGEHSLPVIKIAQLRAGNTIGADRASSNLECDYIIQDGDILFSWSGSLECVLWAGGPGALNQHLFKVTSEIYPKWFCYLGIHLHLDDFRRIAAGKATTMGHIQRHHLTDAKLVVPPTALLRAADVVMAPIIGDIWRLSVQSRTLAALRDTLLPKLISGELRAQNAGCFTRRGV
ncbi:DUF559 domain-containing protein [Metallibacterium sp.]|uniref:DUF559 domain-containing protein n=1 Tax=Metallibacterium sp. TaxID=2940281 RepID=UPI002632A8C7|nr:DUF559 domain-containing protein [Metallibacterium sp.]